MPSPTAPFPPRWVLPCDFYELGGAAACRSNSGGAKKGETFSASPYIPRILGTVDRRGISQKAGYYFIVYMPTSTESGSATTGTVNVSLCESTYIAYAWPQESGRSGVRIFAIDQQGQPYCIGQSPYSGLSNPPPWDFAFAKNKSGSAWESGIDENKWRPVG